MPRKGYTSTGHNSLPNETIKQIDALMKDPAFIREMRRAGHVRISRALVLRVGLTLLLKKYKVIETSEKEEQ